MTSTLVELLPFEEQNARRMAEDIWMNWPTERQFLEHMLAKDNSLTSVLPALFYTFEALLTCFKNGSTLFLCGNGGSCADCMHIAGELVKSFLLRRRLSANSKVQFAHLEFGDTLAEHLEYGVRCHVLGFNHSLNSAILNDSQRYEMQYAQELYVFGKPGDILLSISTSGNALNVLYAVSTAKALGMQTVGMTGNDGGKLAGSVDIAIKTPAMMTYHVQEQHSIIYHALCAMVEARLFG